MEQDSTGNSIKVGDKVKFRGHEYTIKIFIPGKGLYGTSAMIFEEACHTIEVPDEITVDLIPRGELPVRLHEMEMLVQNLIADNDKLRGLKRCKKCGMVVEKANWIDGYCSDSCRPTYQDAQETAKEL